MRRVDNSVPSAAAVPVLVDLLPRQAITVVDIEHPGLGRGRAEIGPLECCNADACALAHYYLGAVARGG